MDFEIDINKKILLQVQRGLESAIDNAVKQSDIDSAASNILSTILLRTSRGRFLTQKTGGRAKKETYRSESWKKKRRDKGLQTGHVSLFYGEGGLLEAMRVRGRSRGGEVQIEAGYIGGLSETRASEIADYMNSTGIGTSRVIYRFIGLAKNEENRIVRNLRNRIQNNLTSG